METYFERISVKSSNTKSTVKTAINLFEKFCKKNYNHNSDYVFEQLGKLKGDVKENQIFDTMQDFINDLNEQNYTAWTVRLTVLRLKPSLFASSKVIGLPKLLFCRMYSCSERVFACFFLVFPCFSCFCDNSFISLQTDFKNGKVIEKIPSCLN